MLVKKIILLALSLGSFLSTGSIPVQKEEASYTQLAIKENIETSPKRLSDGNHKVYEETCEEIEQRNYRRRYQQRPISPLQQQQRQKSKLLQNLNFPNLGR